MRLSLFLIATSAWAQMSMSIIADTHHSSEWTPHTWTALTEFSVPGSGSQQTFYATNAATGASHTFSTTSTAATLNVQCWSNISTSSPFEAGTNLGNNGSGTSIQPSSVTPVSANDLLIGGAHWEAAGHTLSVSGPSMTVSDQTDFNSGVNYGGGMAYLVVSSTSPVNPTMAFGGSTVNVSASWAIFANSGTPSLINHVQCAGLAGCTTAGISTTGANFCVATVSAGGLTALNVSDVP